MRNIKVVDFTYGRRSSDDVNTSLPFTDNYKETKTIQQANAVIASYVNENIKDIAEVNSNIDDLVVEVESKQDELVSGENIKTINGESLLGSGDISVVSDVTWGDITGDIDDQTDLKNALDSKQETLIGTETTGQNIKTINGNTILGTGNLSISAGSAEWGNITGDIDDQTDLQTALSGKQATLVSGTNIKTINSESLLGSTDISVQTPLVSGTSIKTINKESLLGSGNIYNYPNTGWNNFYNITSAELTYDSWDNTTKIGIVNTTQDVRSTLQLGMKLRFRNNSIDFKYAIIIGITNNSITLYFGSNAILENDSINNVYYSGVDCPDGCPVDIRKLDDLYLPVEIPIGNYNGRVLYRKTVSGTRSGSAETTINYSTWNVYEFKTIAISTYSDNGAYFYAYPYYANNDDQYRIYTNTNDKNICINCGASFPGRSGQYVGIVEYTKSS